MQLIANGTQGPTTPPAKQTPVGTPGYGYGGPPGSTPATDVDPDIFNTMLAELVSVATATNNTLDPANNAQAIGAIKTLSGANATGVSVAGSTTLTASQAGLVEVNAAAGNITIDLPAPNSTGTVFRFEFLRIDASANTVTVQTPSGTIIREPSSAASITLPPSSLTRLICDSSDYVQDGPYIGASAIAAPARNFQFTSNGTFGPVPDGITELLVSGCAGGAGGSSTYSGGAGQPVIKYPIAVTPGHTLSITIGAAGTGGPNGSSGTAGGNTVLTDTTTSTVLLTLVGATAAGASQSIGYPSGGSYMANYPSPGASGPFGGGGPSGGSVAGTNGGNAYGYGAGGGESQTATGGNGAPGFLMLEF